MSDRLNELQRQRALLQQHLAWLDREIAIETGIDPKILPAATPAAPIAVAAPAAGPSPAAAGDLVGAERIMAQYRRESTSVKDETRKGCFLYLALAFAVVGLGVLALYLYSVSKQ